MVWDYIINPFITVLTFLYSVLGNNIVLAIVVFTVLVRLVLFPLTMQQQRSSKAMQQIQPEMKKLQEKHKNDREALAKAQMELYREFGVNPLGGCLPMFVQLPIMLGLYQAIIFGLASTPYQLLELSGRLLIPGLDNLVPLQNQFLGLNLTQPPSMINPVSFALPVFVVITTYLQFKMTMPSTPPPSDDDDEDKSAPNQAQQMTKSMGTIMPIMYGFFALQFSIGLSIYFIVSNLIGIVQYSMMGRGDIRQVIGLGKGKNEEAPKMIEAKSTSSKNDSNVKKNGRQDADKGKSGRAAKSKTSKASKAR
jgi:YidC/Oxa1 family membrane protein insertase